MNKFVEWLNQELNQRGWSYSDLARRAALSRSAVSTVISETQAPGLKFCVKVSKALGYPPEYVLRKAELIPPSPEDKDPELLKWFEFGRKLTPEQREDAVRYVLWRWFGGQGPDDSST